MSFENSKEGAPNQGFLLSCDLQALQGRSQADFEIDFYEQILSRDPDYADVLFRLGDLFSKRRLYRRALRVDLKLAELRPRNPSVWYNLACSHGALDHEKACLDALEQAAELGFCDADYMLSDPDLLAVRLHPRFRRLVERVRSGASSNSTIA